MDIYDKDVATLLAEHGVLLVSEGGRHYIDTQSLAALERYIGVLRAENARLKEVVMVVGTDEPQFRFKVGELRKAHKSLTRRAEHLYADVRQRLADGVPKSDTSYDRQEIQAAGVALPLIEAALSKALRDNEQFPGGISLGSYLAEVDEADDEGEG